MEGKSVMPMEIIFMDMDLRSLRYIYSNPFRSPFSSLGSTSFFLRTAEREQ
jgi:hypothetical protein